ncbi:MAG: NAD-dependent epimerase/dehydratase family protein [Phototrophicaceae bacterium]
MKNILIIGGTRNIGFFLANRLVAAGHRLTILNRGLTADNLPDSIHRLRCDRTDIQQMRRALATRTFDIVIDTVLYKEPEAEAIVELLHDQVGHYIFISTGQVYLVRQGITRPFKETDYDGPLLPAPEPNTYDYEEWLYGMEKRHVEDVLARAYADKGFPYTSLRLPMVNSERDGFNRLYSYILRIKDGGPVLVPDTPDYPLRHVYAGDVVEAIVRLIDSGTGKGRAFNISQDETVRLEDFLRLVGDIMNITPDIRPVPRDTLESHGFLPDCSPFSDLWMSELDNTRSKTELNMVYTPLRTYLERIVAHNEEFPPAAPASYRRRRSEKRLVETT